MLVAVSPKTTYRKQKGEQTLLRCVLHISHIQCCMICINVTVGITRSKVLNFAWWPRLQGWCQGAPPRSPSRMAPLGPPMSRHGARSFERRAWQDDFRLGVRLPKNGGTTQYMGTPKYPKCRQNEKPQLSTLQKLLQLLQLSCRTAAALWNLPLSDFPETEVRV